MLTHYHKRFISLYYKEFEGFPNAIEAIKFIKIQLDLNLAPSKGIYDACMTFVKGAEKPPSQSAELIQAYDETLAYLKTIS